jgi:enoyl-CoA hydratase/carnithine racemase
MSNQEPVLFELDDQGVALITLNRPDKLNACSGAMLSRLAELYQRCDEDDAVRAVVVTGSGRAFCTGADMTDAAKTFDVSKSGGFDHFSAAGVEFPAFRIRKLVVAAVNGHAIGLGMTLTMQCDLRIFAREGKYGIVQVRRGVMGDAYAHWTVVRLVGLARAAEILLTGRTFSGDEIERLGVASEVRPAAEVLPRALELARDTAVHAAPPLGRGLEAPALGVLRALGRAGPPPRDRAPQGPDARPGRDRGADGPCRAADAAVEAPGLPRLARLAAGLSASTPESVPAGG